MPTHHHPTLPAQGLSSFTLLLPTPQKSQIPLGNVPALSSRGSAPSQTINSSLPGYSPPEGLENSFHPFKGKSKVRREGKVQRDGPGIDWNPGILGCGGEKREKLRFLQAGAAAPHSLGKDVGKGVNEPFPARPGREWEFQEVKIPWNGRWGLSWGIPRNPGWREKKVPPKLRSGIKPCPAPGNVEKEKNKKTTWKSAGGAG